MWGRIWMFLMAFGSLSWYFLHFPEYFRAGVTVGLHYSRLQGGRRTPECALSCRSSHRNDSRPCTPHTQWTHITLENYWKLDVDLLTLISGFLHSYTCSFSVSYSCAVRETVDNSDYFRGKYYLLFITIVYMMRILITSACAFKTIVYLIVSTIQPCVLLSYIFYPLHIAYKE